MMGKNHMGKQKRKLKCGGEGGETADKIGVVS